MGNRARKFPLFFIATTFLLSPAGETFAAGTCTVATARQSAASAQVLCECDAVTSGMIRYIQRRHDFDQILARVGAECAPLAGLLSDFPTASIGVSDQRSGDGPSQENGTTSNGGGGNPTGGEEPGGEEPGGEEPGGEEPGGEEPDGEEPGGEEPGGEEPGGEEPGGEEPGGEEPGGEEPGGEEPGGEEPGGEEPGGEEPKNMEQQVNERAQGMRSAFDGKNSAGRGLGNRERR
ncbi:hypothetical protein [Ruegeria sp. HKCCSA071]|uniref:hypothetical protein n=1 Tax=Ruegeria sp. HKCCSA071 TaxID=2794834 RepID=UPI001AE4CAD4|nr:hypothetical protein [Ruegeria sp. HKCCSA071]